MPYKNKEDLAKNKKNYYLKNKSEILRKQKIQNEIYKKEKSEYDKVFYLKNKEEKLNQVKDYYHNNANMIKENRKDIKSRFQRARSVAKRKGREFSLTLEEYITKIDEPCYYCNDFFPRVQLGIGLDRLNNSQGYILTNVVSCCKNCNQIKMDILTPEETKAALAAVIKIRNNRS